MRREARSSAPAESPPTHVVLADGRRLAYAEYGAPGGRPLLLLHGTPGGRLQASIMDEAAIRTGVRIIAPDRPGMGASDPRPDLSFVDVAEDLRELVRHLRLHDVVVGAISGGGGFALALARLQPQLVSKLILVSATAPVPARVRRKTGLAGRLMSMLAVRWPQLAAELMERGFARVTDEASLAQMASRLAADDARVLSTPAARALFLGAATRDMLRQGLRAAVHELALYERPPAFDLRDIAVPVVLLHGDADDTVPLGIAQHVAAQIPAAQLHVIGGAAHLFIVERPQLLLDLV